MCGIAGQEYAAHAQLGNDAGSEGMYDLADDFQVIVIAPRFEEPPQGVIIQQLLRRFIGTKGKLESAAVGGGHAEEITSPPHFGQGHGTRVDVIYYVNDNMPHVELVHFVQRQSEVLAAYAVCAIGTDHILRPIGQRLTVGAVGGHLNTIVFVVEAQDLTIKFDGDVLGVQRRTSEQFFKLGLENGRPIRKVVFGDTALHKAQTQSQW